MAVVNSNEDIAFEVIDPASPPDKDDFIKPNRPLMIFIGGIAGLMIGAIWAFVRNARLNRYRRHVDQIIAS